MDYKVPTEIEVISNVDKNSNFAKEIENDDKLQPYIAYNRIVMELIPELDNLITKYLDSSNKIKDIVTKTGIRTIRLTSKKDIITLISQKPEYLIQECSCYFMEYKDKIIKSDIGFFMEMSNSPKDLERLQNKCKEYKYDFTYVKMIMNILKDVYIGIMNSDASLMANDLNTVKRFFYRLYRASHRYLLANPTHWSSFKIKAREKELQKIMQETKAKATQAQQAQQKNITQEKTAIEKEKEDKKSNESLLNMFKTAIFN